MGLDNFFIDVTAEGKADFERAMKIAFNQHTKATHYSIDKEYGLVFYWADSKTKDTMPLAFPHNVEGAIYFAWNWLKQVEYEAEQYHDGSNKKGWRVYTEDWGHVKGRWEAIVGIKPTWAMYGK